MPMGRPKAELMLTQAEREQLQSMVRLRSIPAALVARVRIMPSCAAGEPNSSVADRMELIKLTVDKWRRRFVERRISRLYDELRPGKPRTIDDERVVRLINKTLHTRSRLVGSTAGVRARDLLAPDRLALLDHHLKG